jgi:hypothetical protein
MEVEGRGRGRGEVVFQTKRDGMCYTIEYYIIKKPSI